MAISAIDAAQATSSTSSTKSIKTTNPINTKIGETKTTDEFGLVKVAKPAGLKQESYKVQPGDNLKTIAKHFGINRGDLLAQLKDKGPEKGIAADYNPDAVPHAHDPKCLGEHKIITISLPKDEAQKAEYKAWMKYERAHYDQCIKHNKKTIACNETGATSFLSMA